MNIKKILPYLLVVLGFLLLSYAYVPQVLSGKIVNQSDISGWRGMAQEMISWNAAHPDDKTAWSNSMFGGMPTVTINAPSDGDWTQPIYKFLLWGKRPANFLFISLLGAFLMLLSLGVNVWVAAVGAIAVTFCSYNLQIIQVGHNTKMQAIAFLPWALAAFFFTYRKALGGSRWLPLTCLGSALFALAMSLQVKANHPQITYYLAIIAVCYALGMLVHLLLSAEGRSKLGHFFAASALLLVLGCAGVATNANKLLPIWKYTPYSMRGGSAATGTDGGSDAGSAAGSAAGKKAVKGLDLDYATAWSYGWEELPNMLIPNYNGGFSAGRLKSKSESVKLLKRAGYRDDVELPLYWGPQPFTAGPMYMGAVTIFLFILGLFVLKGRQKWWIVACTLVAVFLALGHHFMWFTKFFYNCVPLYNKFRSVSMALVVLQFTLPLLGFVALDQVLKSGDSGLKFKVIRSALFTLGLVFVLAVLQAILGSFSSSADAGLPEQLTDALESDRRSLMWADTLRSMLLVVGSAGILLWGLWVPSSARKTFETQPEMGFARRRTSVLLLGALIILDMFTVGHRYLNASHFTTPRQFQAQFNKRPVDEKILADTDPSYRVLDLTVNVFNDSHPSYWHKNVGGYSPAKLQIYQKYIESHLTSEIASVYSALKGAATYAEAQQALPYLEGLAKLNCRYIILDDAADPLVYPYAKGPAWFDGAEGVVSMVSYAPNCLVYNCESLSGGKIVFSEVYYPEGWSAVLEDGSVLDISLSDEVFRSVVVPAGSHQITMRFAPSSYSIGEAVSRGSSILILLLLLCFFVFFASHSRKYNRKNAV